MKTCEAVCTTVTATFADALPDVTLSCAVPFATAVARPVELTVTTPALLVVHATLAPVIGVPVWSLTTAVSCWEPPIAVRVMAADGATSMVVGAGGSELSSQVLRTSGSAIKTAPNRRG